jgi:hypothetical protein
MAGRSVGLVGRSEECRVIDELREDARGGRSRALVVREEPGIGNSALPERAVVSARGFQIVRATGIESERSSCSQASTSCVRRCSTDCRCSPSPSAKPCRRASGSERNWGRSLGHLATMGFTGRAGCSRERSGPSDLTTH